MKLSPFNRLKSQLRSQFNTRPTSTLPLASSWANLEKLEPRMLLSADTIFAPPSSVGGTVFNDINANGQRDLNEHGLPGVVVYADLNNDGELNNNEPRTETLADNPLSLFNEAGHYKLEVPAGRNVIRQIVPEGAEQTFPRLHLDADLHHVEAQRVEPGRSESYKITDVGTTNHLDTANVPEHPGVYIQHTVVWPDNLSKMNPELTEVSIDDGQIKISSFADFHLNPAGARPLQEVHTVDLGHLEPGEYRLTSVLHEQTGDFSPHYSTTWEITGVLVVTKDNAHHVYLDFGDHADNLNFGNHTDRVEPGTVTGTKFNDINGNGQRDSDEPGLPGVVIYADLNNNRQLDENEPHTRTQHDNPNTNINEAGHYVLENLTPGRMTIREIIPDGWVQTTPGSTMTDFRTESVRVGPGSSISFDLTDAQFDLSGFVPALNLEHTVVWNDGCGHLLPQLTTAEREGNKIHLDMFGQHAGDVCTEALVPETNTFSIGLIEPGEYEVRTVLHERFLPFPYPWPEPGPYPLPLPVEDGNVISPEGEILYPEPEFTETWVVESTIIVGGAGGYPISLEPGEKITGLDFGNQQKEPPTGTVIGTKFNDRNGNAQRDPDEPGLPGIIIYADLNNDGRLNNNEPHTRTMEDNPITRFDESGRYVLDSIPAGEMTIREIIPDGWVQTTPGFAVTSIRSESVDVGPGTSLSFNLTNAETDVSGIVPALNLEHTVVWRDGCGHLLPDLTTAERDGNTIHLDMYGQHAGGICTLALVPETSDFSIGLIEPGEYHVRTVLHERTLPYPIPVPLPAEEGSLPDNEEDFFDSIPFEKSWVVESTIIVGGEGGYPINLEPGQTIDGLNFGNKRIEKPTASVQGLKFYDRNLNGERDPHELGIGGVIIYADLNNNNRLDPDEPQTRTMHEDPYTDFDEGGLYSLADLPAEQEIVIREVVPNGWVQTFPREKSGHHVVLEPNENRDGLDFGNRKRRIIWGDINRDEILDHLDIDMIRDRVNHNDQNTDYDVNDDNEVNDHDIKDLIHNIFRTDYGDCNLDGIINLEDLASLATNFGKTGDWSKGDANGDGMVNLEDLASLATNFGKEYAGTRIVDLTPPDDDNTGGISVSEAFFVNTSQTLTTNPTNPTTSWDHIDSLLDENESGII